MIKLSLCFLLGGLLLICSAQEAPGVNPDAGAATNTDSSGLLLAYQGGQLAEAGRYYEAIQKYHQAILQFHPDFTDASIYKNPETFADSVSYASLFDVLTAKANAFEHLSAGKKNIKALKGALNAYQSASLLTAFVEKTFDSEEARLFLRRTRYNAENGPLKVNLELFELTEKKSYLDDAYLLDQENKISNFFSADLQKNIIEAIPSIAAVQQLIDRRTAVLSFHLSGNELISLIITRNKAGYHIEPVDQVFFQSLDSFRLSVARINQHYNPLSAMELYKSLILPLHEKLTDVKRMIIIPDEQLRYLPFEALQKSDNQYLLEEYTIQYQYTTGLLGKDVKREKKSGTILMLDSMLTSDSLLHKNRIVTLWKGEDTTSGFIKKQLFKYLDEGYSRDQALQKARFDLVKDDEIDPRYKTPAHWAQFAYIGQYEPPYTPTPWLLIAVICSVVVAIAWVITIKSNF